MDNKIIFNVDEEKYFADCVQNKNLPKNDASKQIILKRIMKDFEKNRIYSEQEVNEIIKKYFEDYATLRRELINFGYMTRDNLTQNYKVVKTELFKEDYLAITRLKEHAQRLGILEKD